MIDICLCTHNPRLDVLGTVLKSIAAQIALPEGCSFLLVDNDSVPPLDESVLAPLRERNIACRLVAEPRAGIFHARNRAMRECSQSLLLWIDDDTQFPHDYVAKCLAIAHENPGIGCFGGKLALGPDCRYTRWTIPIHPWLAIIDRGDVPITNKADHWGPWEPPTAGAVVRRKVIDCYLEFVSTLPPTFSIGQVRTNDLMRGEDSLLMRMAHRLDLACSYQPILEGIHHLDNKRFRFSYLFRLFYGYGRSHVRLTRILGNNLLPLTRRMAWDFFWTTKPRNEHPNWGVFLLMKAWNLGFISERTIRRG